MDITEDLREACIIRHTEHIFYIFLGQLSSPSPPPPAVLMKNDLTPPHHHPLTSTGRSEITICNIKDKNPAQMCYLFSSPTGKLRLRWNEHLAAVTWLERVQRRSQTPTSTLQSKHLGKSESSLCTPRPRFLWVYFKTSCWRDTALVWVSIPMNKILLIKILMYPTQ